MIEQPTIRKSTFNVTTINEIRYSNNEYEYGKQYCIILNCYSTIEDGSEVLIPMSNEQLKFKNEREKIIDQIKSAIYQKCYYEDSDNSFHCPSGIPRMGWESSKRRALDDYREINSPSFRAKAAEYGIQLPKIKYSYFGYCMNVEIDDNSMIIPGFKHNLMVRQ